MAADLDRRLLLKAGTFGLGALATPGAAALLQATGFSHGVASGAPAADRMMLWTRFLPPADGSSRLDYQVAETPEFRRLAAGGSVTARPDDDWCVKPVATGLEPGRTYHYRFVDERGRFSPVGRTRTLPAGRVERFRIGIFSCANLPFGWFNAYRHAVAADDLDLVVHLGDYLYEYEVGRYPSAAEALAGRLIAPAGEIVALADYRLRHAAYRADPDLQALHARYPIVAMWDDHETANDAWAGGAENHQPETEGEWAARKTAAVRAYREWLPVGDQAWEGYRIGELADLFRPETRVTGRSKPLDFGEALAGRSDAEAALVAFRDGPWRDTGRTMMGAEQEAWLAGGLQESVRRGAKWQLLAQQVVVGSLSLSDELAGFLDQGASEAIRRRTAAGRIAARVGLPFNLDAWDGYPAARERLLGSAQEAGANLVTLSGDSHNAWAFDLDHGGRPAGVDLAVQSVTSSGIESVTRATAPAEVARAMVARNRQLKWADTSRRGYLVVELTPQQATGQWLMLDTVRERSTALAATHRMAVRHGDNRFA